LTEFLDLENEDRLPFDMFGIVTGGECAGVKAIAHGFIVAVA
jgi:hypothetical protein